MSDAPRIVAYYRVSTDRQGRSGLGLEAQAEAVRAYAARAGGRVVAEYTEVESGRRCDRPQLALAMTAAKALRATLAVGKLDRLARNVAFLAAVMDSGLEFVACDQPNATRLTLHILAAVAEDEARRISTRVREALAAYKARGGLLGTRHPRCRHTASADAALRASTAAATVNRRRCAEYREAMQLVIADLRRAGLTWAAVAAELNARGYRNRRGKAWTLYAVEAIAKPRRS